MTPLTQEEIKDELLAIFEEHEDELISYTEKINKIEDDAIELFDRKVIAAKNRLINDTSIGDDELAKKYLEEVEKIRKSIVEEVRHTIDDLIKKQK